MAGFEKQRGVARCHAAIGMARRVIDDIGLGLDDPSADDTFGQLAHHHLADKVARHRFGIDGQFSATEAMIGAHSLMRSTHWARDGPGANGSAKYWVSCATWPSTNSIRLTVWEGRPS